jgi:hypothetical protein
MIALNAILPRLPETIQNAVFLGDLVLWGMAETPVGQPPSRGLIFWGALCGGACLERTKLSCIKQPLQIGQGQRWRSQPVLIEAVGNRIGIGHS